MSDADTEDEQAQTGHRAMINDSWLHAREWIRRANAADVDPQRALWPAGVQQRSYAHETALAAHSATIQFRDDLSAYRDQSGQIEVQDLWQDEVTQVNVNGETYPVSLATLEQWSNKRIQSVQSDWDAVRGETKTIHKSRVLLPVEACQAIYRQIQDVLMEIGFTAETRDVTYKDEASAEDLGYLINQREQEAAKGSLPERFTPGRSDS
jgi:hypothetical protein